MKKRFFALFLLIAVLFASNVISHGNEEDYVLDHSHLFPVSQLKFSGYGSLIFFIMVLIIVLFHKRMNMVYKKLTYSIIAMVSIVVTLYLVLTTLQLNMASITKGPVHWHADFEIWACDNELKLAKPAGFLSNKQGVDLLHAHQDNRMHVEGVILDEKQASLGAFFHAVGGSLSHDGFILPTDSKLESYHDGDHCNEKAGKLYVFVNGELISDPQDYVIAPYEKIPPGDRIKIVFTEKTLNEINPLIG